MKKAVIKIKTVSKKPVTRAVLKQPKKVVLKMAKAPLVKVVTARRISKPIQKRPALVTKVTSNISFAPVVKSSPVPVKVQRFPSSLTRPVSTDDLRVVSVDGIFWTALEDIKKAVSRTVKTYTVPVVSSVIIPAKQSLTKRFSSFRNVFAKGFSVIALGLITVLISLPFMQAFEAHILNVTGTIIQIDPPILTIPGDIGWDNPNGGANLIGDQDIIMSEPDEDGTYIFYTYGPGTDPNVIPDPVCGGANGGPKEAPQHLVINSDTTIKAVACDGPGSGAHHSLINTKIYTFAVPCEDRFIPLDVMIVFDRSGSMGVDGKLAGAKTAAKNFIDILNPTNDQVGLVNFSTSAALSKQLTTDFDSVKASINGLSASGSTNIGDAIDKGNIELSSSRARSNSTKVEILLTDGRANRPGSTDDNPAAVALAQTKADEAAAAGFILYTIGLGPDVNAPFLENLAETTGGQYFSSIDVNQLNDIYTQISHLICGQGKISGIKFNDLNQDGDLDAGEPVVPGWKITLKHGSGTFGTAITDANGFYEFTDLPGNVEFTIEEESRSGWQAINPASGKRVVTLSSDTQNLTGQDFANFNIGQQCESTPVSFPSGVAVLAAGNDSGTTDNVLVSANATINGTLQSNRDVNAAGGGANRDVNGDIIAGNEVNSAANFTVSGGHSILEHQPATALPTLPLSEWQTKAANGGTVNGSLIFPANTIGIDLGPSEILGNVTLGANNAATIKGPLYIHGNLTLGANTTITQDSSFGNNFAIIIVDGTISLGANAEFVGSGSTGAFLLVSTAGATSNGSIQTAANADLDRVVLFATEGNIHVNSNGTVLALFAKHGFSSTHPSIDLEANVTIKGGVLPGQIVCGPDISPDKNLNHVLINEFMPNPTGNDAGLKPNGEWVELHNNSGADVDVNGWVLTNNIIANIGSAQIQTWESSANFAGGAHDHTFVESTGNQRVRVSTGFTSGTYEKVYDAGSGKKGIWQKLAWNSSLSAGASVCLQAATSDDNITYTSYSSSDCTSPFDISALPQTRFIKWKSTHTRTTGLVTNNADLLDVTLTYKPVSFGELVISAGITDTGNTNIAPGEHLVVYRNGSTDFILDNSGGSVTLWNGHPLFGASQIDSHVYSVFGTIPESKSFTRMPDGTANWVDPEATPGEANDEFVTENVVPDQVPTFVSPPEPAVEVLAEPQPGESDYIEPEQETVGPTDESISPTSTDDSLESVLGDSTTSPESTTTDTSTEPEVSTGGGSVSNPPASSDSSSDQPPVTPDPVADPVADSTEPPVSPSAHAAPETPPAQSPEPDPAPAAENKSADTAEVPPANQSVSDSPPSAIEPQPVAPPPAVVETPIEN